MLTLEFVTTSICQCICYHSYSKQANPQFRGACLLARGKCADPKQSRQVVAAFLLLDVGNQFNCLTWGFRVHPFTGTPQGMLEAFPLLDAGVASGLLAALWPACAAREDVKDALVLAMRRSMFGRDVNARLLAARGFLFLVTRELSDDDKAAPANLCSQSSASQAWPDRFTEAEPVWFYMADHMVQTRRKLSLAVKFASHFPPV